MQDNRIHVDVPRKIVHSKSDEMRYSDNGTPFVWVDVSTAVKLDGYGFWFPSWLVRENLEYCTLIIERDYKSNYTGQIVSNTFIVEHKEKIKGKRFKRFSYSPDELSELLHVYAENVNKAKSASDYKAFARITETTSKQQEVTFYAIGYINGKMFYSEDIERFRRSNYLADRQGGKRISAKSFELIADRLTEDDVTAIRHMIEAKSIAESELAELRRMEMPYPFRYLLSGGKLIDHHEEYTIELLGHSIRKTDHHNTIKGYPQKITEIETAIENARLFLESTIREIENRLSNYTPDKKNA